MTYCNFKLAQSRVRPIPSPKLSRKRHGTLLNSVFNPEYFGDLDDLSGLVWNSKIFCINKIASGLTKMSPEHLFTFNLYTSNPMIAQVLNRAIAKKNIGPLTAYVKLLDSALKKVADFPGEVFIGANNIDRKYFAPGAEFNWPTIMSASTLWKVAMEHVTEFDTKSKRGTIFIVQSKTGKYVGQYSQFSYDAEVIFRAGSRFRVKAWYRGDPICLGQANIREHTFGIHEQEEMDRMMNGNKSLIIELEEV